MVQLDFGKLPQNDCHHPHHLDGNMHASFPEVIGCKIRSYWANKNPEIQTLNTQFDRWAWVMFLNYTCDKNPSPSLGIVHKGASPRLGLHAMSAMSKVGGAYGIYIYISIFIYFYIYIYIFFKPGK